MISNSQPTNSSDLCANTEFGDSIAHICWYPSEPSPLLAVSSWDSKIRIYKPPQPDSPQTLEETFSYTSPFPAICQAWKDSQSLIFGTIDGEIRILNLGEGERDMIVGKHADAVKGVFYLPEDHQFICSVSYDKTLKLWDTRDRNFREVLSIDLGGKAISCDMTYPYLLIGLDSVKYYRVRIDLMVANYDIGRLYESPLTVAPTPMTFTSASISKERTICFGSDLGRSLVAWLDPSDPDHPEFPHRRGYNWRAHQTRNIESENSETKYIGYPVNTVGLHPKNKNTSMTAGRDGFLRFWDINGKKALTAFSCDGVPVTEAKYSPDGKFLAYGVGYDWSIGIEGAKSFHTKLYVHTVQPNELAPE